jgi:hypothetical protein
MAILNNSNAISSGGYDINNSLRFRASASAFLSRTPASASNRQTWTWSGWVKRGRLGSDNHTLFTGRTSASATYTIFLFTDTNTLWLVDNGGTSLVSTAVYRDPSAWYHVVLAVDTTQATAANRVKMYVNGTQITSFSTATYPTQNANLNVNSTATQVIGDNTGANQYFDGQMAEINFVDGSQKTPSDFGETDAITGSWVAKKYTGTYGTNGFYLKFADASAATAAAIGKDSSGNGNNWTPSGISVTAGTTYDAMIDSPTLTSATVANYAVMNPLGNAVGNAPATLSEGNLTCKNTATSYLGALGTIGLPTSGKFYWEVQLTQNSGPSNLSVFGIAPSNIPLTGNQANYANSIAWYMGNTTLIQLPSSGGISISGSGSITTDVFQICYDGSTGKVYFGKNNTFYNSAGSGTGNPSSGTNETATLTTGDLLPWFFAYQEGAYFNFGQRPFSYTPPTGFVRLNTYNLPDSTIKKGNTVMDANIWTGNGTGITITNSGAMKPDLMWIKSRSVGGYYHVLTDSVRGITKALYSNATDSENTLSTRITAINSNGFSLGTSGDVNDNAQTFVGWQWQAGQGSTSSNTSGSITSTVSVNTTAGFSVVTYTGTGANATVGHGLGVAPKWIIAKCRGAASQWGVYHTSIDATPQNYALLLNSTAAKELNSLYWNNTAPTSTVFSLGGSSAANTSGQGQVAYCWAEIAGFSSFGSYTGNGSTDGPMIFTGFKPKFVMWKLSSNAGGDWKMFDTSRNTYNITTAQLSANSSAAESSSANMDFLSNGFKIRANWGDTNTSGYTYIYMAFAENPFKNSNAF